VCSSFCTKKTVVRIKRHDPRQRRSTARPPHPHRPSRRCRWSRRGSRAAGQPTWGCAEWTFQVFGPTRAATCAQSRGYAYQAGCVSLTVEAARARGAEDAPERVCISLKRRLGPLSMHVAYFAAFCSCSWKRRSSAPAQPHARARTDTLRVTVSSYLGLGTPVAVPAATRASTV
jgi:hypothetical protein